MNQQQGGQGRRNRNRGGGGQGGGGGLNIPGVPQHLVRNALDQIEVGELRDILLDRLEADNRRAEEKHQADLAKTAAETEASQSELEQRRAEAQAENEKRRQERESASRESAREAAAKVARGFALFTQRMTVARFSGEYRKRVTERFQDQLTPEARNHFCGVLATYESEEAIRSTLMALARITNDEERFNTARDLGLIPENYRREERH